MIAEVSTGLHNHFLLCPHPLQPKVESPDGIFGTTWGFTGLFLPEEAADPASTGPQTHRRIATPRRSPRSNSPPWVFELLIYAVENLFRTLSREVAGQTTVPLGHNLGSMALGGLCRQPQSPEGAADFSQELAQMSWPGQGQSLDTGSGNT